MLAQHSLLAFDPQSNHQVFGTEAKNAVSDTVRQGLNFAICRISWDFSFGKLSCLLIRVDLSRPLASSQRSVCGDGLLRLQDPLERSSSTDLKSNPFFAPWFIQCMLHHATSY